MTCTRLSIIYPPSSTHTHRKELIVFKPLKFRKREMFGSFSTPPKSPFDGSFGKPSQSASTPFGKPSQSASTPFSTSSQSAFAGSFRTESFGFTSSRASPTTRNDDDTVYDLRRRISFLTKKYTMAFKEQTLTDIMLKPNDGPSISTHKSLLAARSEIFKNILISDDFKAPPSDADTITLSELNTEELNSLLEFLYTGDLPADKFENHAHALYVAADKYEIRYLQEVCERYMLDSLDASNALDNLVFSDSHSKKKIKETTLDFIVKDMKSIVATRKYEEFACSKPCLCVEVTRAFFDAKVSAFRSNNNI